MSERAAFIRSIIEEPDDDTVRLAFADWLDEQGETARAEFVRVQVELARMKDPHSGLADINDALTKLMNVSKGRPKRTKRRACRCRHCSLRRREWHLWQVNGCGWLFTVFGVTQTDVRNSHHAPGSMSGSVYGSGHEDHISRIDQDFRRGFVETVTCTAADWLAHADAITAAHPVRKVTLTTVPELDNFRNAPSIDGVMTRFKGRHREIDWPRGERSASVIARLLEAEWPGVTFELPPARDLTFGELADEVIRNAGAFWNVPSNLIPLPLEGPFVIVPPAE